MVMVREGEVTFLNTYYVLKNTLDNVYKSCYIVEIWPLEMLTAAISIFMGQKF